MARSGSGSGRAITARVGAAAHEIAVADRVNALFLSIARTPMNPEHLLALQAITEKLEPVQRIEPLVFDELDSGAGLPAIIKGASGRWPHCSPACNRIEAGRASAAQPMAIQRALCRTRGQESTSLGACTDRILSLTLPKLPHA
jgi:hypothetical protein